MEPGQCAHPIGPLPSGNLRLTKLVIGWMCRPRDFLMPMDEKKGRQASSSDFSPMPVDARLSERLHALDRELEELRPPPEIDRSETLASGAKKGNRPVRGVIGLRRLVGGAVRVIAP